MQSKSLVLVSVRSRVCLCIHILYGKVQMGETLILGFGKH